MSEQNTVNIKQRIVGALVLVSLGIIFIPLLLNGGPDSNNSFLNKNIPAMPQKLTKVLPDVPQPMIMPAPEKIISHPVRTSQTETTIVKKPSKQVGQINNTQKSKIKSTSDKKSKTIADSHYKKAVKPVSSKINMAYTLQIASFSKKTNALALQAKLRKKKFKAYIESILTAKGRIYRLRVGPYLKFKQIAKIKKQIEVQFKLNNTIIVKYKS